MLTVITALLVSSCSTASADVSPSNDSISVIIDVRTPAEFAEGHVVDALNLDVESETFDQAIGSLDKGVTYVVYCRSGRRSAIAAQKMSDAGFTVLDGGSLDNMISQGWNLGA